MTLGRRTRAFHLLPEYAIGSAYSITPSKPFLPDAAAEVTQNHSVKSTLKNLGRNYGVHVRYMPRLINMGPDYEVVLPNATYSSWNLDKAFIAALSGRRPVVKGCFEAVVNVLGAVMSTAC